MSITFQNLTQNTLRVKNKKPPVHLWNPPFCGDIDIRIAADGRWFHEGALFQRQPLVELLASILKLENGEYFLVSPVEKVRIQVEDAPFVALRYRRIEFDGESVIEFETNVGDSVCLDAEHPLRVVVNEQTGEPRPYIMVRDGLEALVHRNVFYQLIEEAQTADTEAGLRVYIISAGIEFELGLIE